MDRNPPEYELFCENKIFQGLTENELKAFFIASKKCVLDKGEVLFTEGESADKLYIIIKGSLEVTKRDHANKENYSLDILHTGDTVGEISLIDKGVRSATVKAKTKTEIRSISFKELEEIISKSPECGKIYLLLSKNISQKLRNTNTIFLENLKTRITMGVFIVNIIMVLCIFTYFMGALHYLVEKVANTSYIVMPMSVGFAILLVCMMKISKLEWKEFGITKLHWKRAVCEGFLLPIPLVIFCIAVKVVSAKIVPDLFGSQIFDFFGLIKNPDNRTWSYWILLNCSYWFLIVPVQELVVRGGIQGLLVHLLSGKYKLLMSLIISNMIYSTLHLFLGFVISIVVFLGGMYIGWIYSRTNNLISSTIAHAILGTLTVSLVQIEIYH